MDSVVQMIPTRAPVLTNVAETNERFHGEIPSAVRFACPYCSRPVIPVAERARQRSPIHYFRHAKDDDWAHQCILYQSGSGAEMDSQIPSLAMALRRDPVNGLFRVEVGVRRRASTYLARALSSKDTMTVDNVPHPLADLVARRGAAVPLDDPLHDPDRRITVPERWWKYVGRARECRGILVFSDEFGENGGRYLPLGSALRAGEDYYVVSGERDSHRRMAARFDSITMSGRLHGPNDLAVIRIRISPSSKRWERANDWLGGYGYCLSGFDRAARLVWPPSLRSSGADEPLFLNATPVYMSPYLTADDDTDDMIDTRMYLRNAREVGLVGFRRLPNAVAGRTRYDVESFCLFLKPDGRMPWTSVIISRTWPDDLHPAGDDDKEETATETDAEPPTVSPTIHASSTGVAVALRRLGFDITHDANHGRLIACNRACNREGKR